MSYLACNVAGCFRDSKTRGMCATHYQEWWVANTTAPLNHGALFTYVVRKCRCDECTTARRDYERRKAADAKEWRELQNYLKKESSK